MAYEALLFCPDEKTARTVTQVLTELEFAVEPCTEPFAAVKKLMGQHFDAIVVDCDNEQNATLLFKSARNSTSNQASLAVAIVEGQAGVAKAFRIGANLVLTKPINVEQSKGTLRVARGLLRKGEPGKPAAPMAAASAPAASTPPATPAKPLATRPAVPARPATPSVSATRPPAAAKPPLTAAPRPTIPTPPAKPAISPASAIAANTANDSAGIPAAPSAIAANPAQGSSKISSTSLASGAASAPAPAREPEVSRIEVAAPAPEIKPGKSEVPIRKSEEPAEAAQAIAAKVEPATSFTFGGANVAETSGGAGKKAILGIVAAVVIAAGAYAGWSYLQSHGSQSTAKTAVPSAISPKPQPTTQPAAPAVPAPEAGSLISHSDSKAVEDIPPSSSDTGTDEAVEEKPAHASKASSKPSAAATAKNAPAATADAAAPLVVKSGSEPAMRSVPAASDAPAPSVIGIGGPSSTGALSNIVGDEGTAKPVLQTMKISQGVAQGLIIKRVAPEYPKNALLMRIEGAVDLVATISKTGDIKDVKVVKGDPQLSRAALQAVKQWKYKPYLLNGEPVDIQTQITVNFDLPR